MGVLLILIAAACFSVIWFGLASCRVAGRSDASRAVAVAEWIAAIRAAEQRALADDGPVHGRLDVRRGPYRAAG
jgi:hypothetical protein